MESSEASFATKLAPAILQYLRRHPQAKDTAQGITEWWLLEQRVLQTQTEVSEALAELIRKNLVVAQVGLGGETCYSLRRTSDS